MKKNIFIFVIFVLFPLAMLWADQLFYVSFASRVMIYAIAATSLNLVLGYGGMISFGHAAFVGTGAYVGSILVAEGVTSAFIGWPAAIAVLGARRLDHRRDLAAHARRVLHHDHARLRADDVLPGQLDEGVRRRRRPDAAAAAFAHRRPGRRGDFLLRRACSFSR